MSKKIFMGGFTALFILFILMFLGYHYLQKPAVVPEEEVLTPEEIHRVEIPFKGRVEIPSAEDFTVVDNSAGRDMERVALFMQGRAAGLHWLAREHFKKSTRKHPLPDVHMEIKLSIDSMGVFDFMGLQSCDTDDQKMLDTLQDHIKKYWRYRRSTSGKTEFVAPFTWTSKY